MLETNTSNNNHKASEEKNRDERNFSRLARLVYILLMLATFTAFTIITGIIPGIVLTLALLALDTFTGRPNRTMIYGMSSLIAIPVFSVYLWIRDRLSANFQKEPIHNNAAIKNNLHGEKTLSENASSTSPITKSSSTFFSSETVNSSSGTESPTHLRVKLN